MQIISCLVTLERVQVMQYGPEGLKERAGGGGELRPWISVKSRSGATKILDAGSGVTFFPYYLCQNLPQAQVICCDNNLSYPPMFAAINARTDHARVSFIEAKLQSLPLPDGDLDCVYCISVLEHTDHYGQILREFARVTKPGAKLILTFDLSLDGRFPLSRAAATKLLQTLAEYFQIDGVSVDQELSRMDARDATILSTDYVKRTDPQLLPWRYPMAKAVHDLIKGHGWTGGFRSKSAVRGGRSPKYRDTEPYGSLSPSYRC